MTADLNNNNKDNNGKNISIEDELAQEAEELDGYFSDKPLDPKPLYPPLNESFDSAIIITNLPQVPVSKLDKLTKVVFKLVSKIGALAADAATGFTGLHMPLTKSKEGTVGFCFVIFEQPEQAKNAVTVLQGYKFDKNHLLAVTSYPRAKSLQSVDTASFPEPTLQPFQEKPNAMEWLQDSNQRDSFVVRFDKETVVYWFDGGKSDPVVDYDGRREKEAGVQWCEYYCHWSPAGSYLATLVPAKGVILWSGKNYEKVGRFVAPHVQTILFSPRENYLLTNNHRIDDPAAIKVYHIPTGNLLRAFPLYPDNIVPDSSTDTNEGDNGGGRPPPPPPFLWSHDDNYLARQGTDLIKIFATPSMKLLDSRSVNAPGIQAMQWSPSANIFAYWAPEASNSPAHVDLIEIPSRKKLRQKNLFNVTNCNMVWHDQGDYLAVKVTRHTKSKKTLYNNIELFRLNGDAPGIPVEMLDTKDAVMSLTWEPKGSRFAMIHAENPSAAKVNVSFYDMMKKQQTDSGNKSIAVGSTQQQQVPELHKLETLQGRQCNSLFWSPAGSTIIMASLGDTASGTLEFYDLDSNTVTVKEHYRANQILWDPSGRSVASIVSQPIEGGGSFKFSMNNGYILWSFQGKQLYQQSYETFFQFIWRPRESLLSNAEIERVKKNLKSYEKRFDKADRKRERARYLEETKGKRAERAKYRELLARNKAIRTRYRDKHIQLNGGYDSEDEANYVVREVTIEKILSTKEEIVM